MTPRERTAHHEAGHAVVGLLLRLNVRSADIRPIGDQLGSITHGLPKRKPWDWPSDDWCIRAGHVTVAGEVAEWDASGRKRHNHLGALSDYQEAADLALHLEGSGRAATRRIRQWQAQALVMIVDYRIALETVARMLDVRGFVSRRDMIEAIASAYGRPFPGLADRYPNLR